MTVNKLRMTVNKLRMTVNKPGMTINKLGITAGSRMTKRRIHLSPLFSYDGFAAVGTDGDDPDGNARFALDELDVTPERGGELAVGFAPAQIALPTLEVRIDRLERIGDAVRELAGNLSVDVVGMSHIQI